MKTFLTLLFWSTFLSVTLWASPPVPFIGKVSIRQVNYSGDAQFTFSLHDGKGTILWTNGEKPRETIKVPVHNGRYHVLLGGQGMTSLPPSLFLKNEDLYLRVEFDNEDGNGLRHLKPDQLITATPACPRRRGGQSGKGLRKSHGSWHYGCHALAFPSC